MIYASLLVFVAVAFWRAGWRKGLEITGISFVICLIFALTFSTSIWDVPRNLRTALHAILYFPAYVIKHPALGLNLLTPTAIVAAVWLLFIALRRLRKKPATEDEPPPLSGHQPSNPTRTRALFPSQLAKYLRVSLDDVLIPTRLCRSANALV